MLEVQYELVTEKIATGRNAGGRRAMKSNMMRDWRAAYCSFHYLHVGKLVDINENARRDTHRTSRMSMIWPRHPIPVRRPDAA